MDLNELKSGAESNVPSEAAEVNPDLRNDIKGLKSDTVTYFRQLLKSGWVCWWFRIFFFAILIFMIWFVAFSLYDILYHSPPKPLFLSIWSEALAFLKTVFAVIGFFWVIVRAVIKLWEERE
ncbi:MAG: hypothetical protein LBF86_02020 [Helicobacteraceae bacterium]|jgi:hypothetical protein|nr:hypothetical protein [Helicobacteraceae bacterium]